MARPHSAPRVDRSKPYAHVNAVDGTGTFAVCGVVPKRSGKYRIHILLVRASEGVRVSTISDDQATDYYEFEGKSAHHAVQAHVSLADAYHLFVKPAVERHEGPLAPDEEVNVAFFRSHAPPEPSETARRLAWQLPAEVADTRPMGRQFEAFMMHTFPRWDLAQTNRIRAELAHMELAAMCWYIEQSECVELAALMDGCDERQREMMAFGSREPVGPGGRLTCWRNPQLVSGLLAKSNHHARRIAAMVNHMSQLYDLAGDASRAKLWRSQRARVLEACAFCEMTVFIATNTNRVFDHLAAHGNLPPATRPSARAPDSASLLAKIPFGSTRPDELARGQGLMADPCTEAHVTKAVWIAHALYASMNDSGPFAIPKLPLGQYVSALREIEGDTGTSALSRWLIVAQGAVVRACVLVFEHMRTRLPGGNRSRESGAFDHAAHALIERMMPSPDAREAAQRPRGQNAPPLVHIVDAKEAAEALRTALRREGMPLEHAAPVAEAAAIGFERVQRASLKQLAETRARARSPAEALGALAVAIVTTACLAIPQVAFGRIISGASAPALRRTFAGMRPARGEEDAAHEVLVDSGHFERVAGPDGGLQLSERTAAQMEAAVSMSLVGSADGGHPTVTVGEWRPSTDHVFAHVFLPLARRAPLTCLAAVARLFSTAETMADRDQHARDRVAARAEASAALTCMGCGKTASEAGLAQLLRCKCRLPDAYFCNRECQKAAYKEHKAACRPAVAAREAAAGASGSSSTAA